MSEEALLLGIRDQIREQCGYSSDECDVQHDEETPHDIGRVYVAVMPGTVTSGPNQSRSGHVRDEIYSIRIAVIEKSGGTPRDRNRNQFTTNLSNINQRCKAIIDAVDFQNSAMNLAGGYIENSTEKFIEPLKWEGTDRIQAVGAEVFKTARPSGVTASGNAGMMRVINFGGARRIITRVY